MANIPNVLCLSGHDPSGGAGLQADIEAIAAQGAHAAGVITALTCQNTRNAFSVRPTPAADFAADIDALLDDMPFAAFKVGLVATPEQVVIITRLAANHPDIPLVVDPVLQAAGGATLAGDPVAQALHERLFPHTTVLTPNADEARRLCGDQNSLEGCGHQLSQLARWVLITGGDEPHESVHNTLYHAGSHCRSFTWPRLPHHYHGSGCTLSSAIAGRLALGGSAENAIAGAQDFTWHSLQAGFQPGNAQHIPERHAGRRQRRP